jgi:Arm DNA-binding domain/GIY-YIG catalytic domain
MKLDAKTVATFELGNKNDVLHFDSTMIGFGYRLRRSTGGEVRRSWIIQYRHAGATRRYRLGSAEILSAEQARVEAKKLLAKVALGEDPQKDKAERRNRKQTLVTLGIPIVVTNIMLRCAKKFQSFNARDIQPANFLYRFYDPTCDLLYVGQSMPIIKRFKKHATEKAWWKEIYQIIIEPFATREEALEAERVAIKTEHPKYNIIYNNRTDFPFQDLAQLI